MKRELIETAVRERLEVTCLRYPGLEWPFSARVIGYDEKSDTVFIAAYNRADSIFTAAPENLTVINKE